MAEVREREEKPLSKTLWVIYQTVSHTCGPQSSAKTPTHKHTIITLQICHRSTHLKTFLAQKRYFVQHQTTCLAVMNITSMFL